MLQVAHNIIMQYYILRSWYIYVAIITTTMYTEWFNGGVGTNHVFEPSVTCYPWV